ncbi:MAG: hypothetical protein ABFD98_16955, partial [Syntrophobacteraceae bacterium]
RVVTAVESGNCVSPLPKVRMSQLSDAGRMPFEAGIIGRGEDIGQDVIDDRGTIMTLLPTLQPGVE